MGKMCNLQVKILRQIRVCRFVKQKFYCFDQAWSILELINGMIQSYLKVSSSSKTYYNLFFIFSVKDATPRYSMVLICQSGIRKGEELTIRYNSVLDVSQNNNNRVYFCCFCCIFEREPLRRPLRHHP